MTELIPAPPETPAEAVNTADVVPTSPRWGVLTKFLVSLVFLLLVGSLLERFQQMLAPLVLAVVLAYLLKPAVENLTAQTRLPWGVASGLVYLLLIVILLSVLTVAGIAIYQQVLGLYNTVANLLEGDIVGRLDAILNAPIDLGFLVIDLSRPFYLGPFGPYSVNVRTGDWEPVLTQVVNALQPALSRTGELLTSLAGSTLSTLGWAFFVLLVSFYLLNDVRNIGVSIERLVPDGYQSDARRLVNELGPIWNAFLRGQLTLGIVMGVLVGVSMGVLGVRYAVVLGLIAGLLEFVPTIGPIIAGTVAVVVALFQPGNWLGLSPLAFAGLVLLVSVVLQQVENSVLVPRIMGGSLGLHPLVILIGALVAANLAGIIGLLLSAPILATLRLFGRYVYRKMFDLDPWPHPPPRPRPPQEVRWARWLQRRARQLRARWLPPAPPAPPAPPG